MKHLWEGGTNVFINNPGHMTKMAAMPIYGKNPSKFFSRTTGPISTKLSMEHRGLEYYYNNIRRSLKPLGQSKPNFIGSIYWEGGTNMYINNPGHMTEMAAMPIYGKTLKNFFSGTGLPIPKKLGMKHR